MLLNASAVSEPPVIAPIFQVLSSPVVMSALLRAPTVPVETPPYSAHVAGSATLLAVSFLISPCTVISLNVTAPLVWSPPSSLSSLPMIVTLTFAPVLPMVSLLREVVRFSTRVSVTAS